MADYQFTKDDLVTLAREVAHLYEDHELISFRANPTRVHLTTEGFVSMFPEFDVDNKRYDALECEISAEYKGVTFFTILSAQEAEMYLN